MGASELSSGQQQAFVWSDGRMRGVRVFGDQSVANDINADGVVVGTSITGPRESPEYRAFVWDRGRAIELIGPGDDFSAASAVSDAGDVVGVSRGPNYDSRSVLWRPTT